MGNSEFLVSEDVPFAMVRGKRNVFITINYEDL